MTVFDMILKYLFGSFLALMIICFSVLVVFGTVHVIIRLVEEWGGDR